MASWQMAPIRQGGAALLIVLATGTGAAAAELDAFGQDQAAFSAGVGRTSRRASASAAQASALAGTPGSARHAGRVLRPDGHQR
jgi:hypothetical protein